MQFLSSKTLLYIRIICLLTVAFYLVKDPDALSTAGFIVLLGQAMQVPLVRLGPENPILGMTAVVVVSTALGDLIPLLSENWSYFENLVPIRLSAYFILASYIYFVPGSVVSNSLVVTFVLFEIWGNFLIYNNLRDEKYYRMKKYVEENKEEIIAAHDEQVRVVELDE
ncbi:Protein ILM1 [Candida viswanathii]|uniref:Protein ILM1 n=1 Tax=Candida viswanathii TaxID=5486 RepID=A0A367XQT1_9ASCO|nr:Protein ILM1 [Candida viswanathii]